MHVRPGKRVDRKRRPVANGSNAVTMALLLHATLPSSREPAALAESDQLKPWSGRSFFRHFGEDFSAKLLYLPNPLPGGQGDLEGRAPFLLQGLVGASQSFTSLHEDAHAGQTGFQLLQLVHVDVLDLIAQRAQLNGGFGSAARQDHRLIQAQHIGTARLHCHVHGET
jgi:hypothetical protein